MLIPIHCLPRPHLHVLTIPPPIPLYSLPVMLLIYLLIVVISRLLT